MIQAKWIPGGGDIAPCLLVRGAVFGKDGQTEPYAAGNDDIAWHLICYDAGTPVGTARLFADTDGAFRYDNIAVMQDFRSLGVGDLIMRILLFKSLEMGASLIRVVCKDDVSSFFAKYGFTAVASGNAMTMEIAAEDVDLSGSCHKNCSSCKA